MKTCSFCKAHTTKPCITEAGTTGCRLMKAKQDADRQEREMNVRWMIDSDKWPRWPILPLKRRDQFGQMGDFGFLVTGKGPVVHIGSLYHIKEGDLWADYSREMFESFENLVAAGWRVD